MHECDLQKLSDAALRTGVAFSELRNACESLERSLRGAEPLLRDAVWLLSTPAQRRRACRRLVREGVVAGRMRTARMSL